MCLSTLKKSIKPPMVCKCLKIVKMPVMTLVMVEKQMVRRVFEDSRNILRTAGSSVKTPSGLLVFVFRLCECDDNTWEEQTWWVWSRTEGQTERREDKADWFGPSVGVTGDSLYFEGQHITESCRELPAGLLPAGLILGWSRRRGQELHGRRVEWHHNATSASAGGETAHGWASRCLSNMLHIVWQHLAGCKHTAGSCFMHLLYI